MKSGGFLGKSKNFAAFGHVKPVIANL